ncbi:DUF1120 domain-containing protein [Pseudomonas sp. PDM27]|uniref:DUF1120 domain-containing protein n=1 Tax=Pseudomonas sp. PDM27 TaxID=2854769 RepID=UPI001C46C22F|nr:DUF1120 domain-containing protein [Pseudomonas sp. PDM27]MBV7566709.1 DUF1120 domain-containing protein [Pseudomonas sp. PDM27]
MKKYFAALSTTALICVAPHALAASNTPLTVTGSITPAACDINLSSGGIVDIGKRSVNDLHPTNNTLLNKTDMQLTMTCSESMLFMLNPIDHRPNTAAGLGDYFGVGLTPDDEKLGFFDITIKESTADTTKVQAIGSSDGGTTWVKQDRIMKDKQSSVAALSDHATRIAVQDLTMDLEIHTYIAGTNYLTLDNEVPIDGLATIEVWYQ